MNRLMLIILLSAGLAAAFVAGPLHSESFAGEGVPSPNAGSGFGSPPFDVNGAAGGGLILVAGDTTRSLSRLKARDALGREVSFATGESAARLTAVSFFATCCCSLCGQELVELKALQERHPSLRVILVSLDRAVDADVKRFVAESGLAAPIVHDNDGAIYDAFGTEQVPQTFVVDRRGRILFEARRYGGGLKVPSWQSAESLAFLRKAERGGSLGLPHAVRD